MSVLRFAAGQVLVIAIALAIHAITGIGTILVVFVAAALSVGIESAMQWAIRRRNPRDAA